MDWFGVSLLFVCHVFFFHVEAQHWSGLSIADKSFENRFPFFAGLASLVCLLCWLLLLCTYFRQGEPIYTGNGHPVVVAVTELMPTVPRLDRAVIESLPKFRFSALKGPKHGMDCPVCLSGFKDDEILRLLPKCDHVFHVKCIDSWLERNSSCPVCRDVIEISFNRSILIDEDDARSGNGAFGRGESNAAIPVEGDEHRPSSRFSNDLREQFTDDGSGTTPCGINSGSVAGN